ncbi:hypothetical protein DL93DRAFT_501491 [Clavulina sp. PMI_390]|nr:hypothetical protein DL93DRAFT_501491 [Clavulina sp. PMI_390]
MHNSTNVSSLSREESPPVASSSSVHAVALQTQSGASPPSTLVNSSVSPHQLTTPSSANYSASSPLPVAIIESQAFVNSEDYQYETTDEGVTIRHTARGGVSVVYLPPRYRGGPALVRDFLQGMHEPLEPVDSSANPSELVPTKMEFLLTWLPASPAESGFESGIDPRSYFVRDTSKPTGQQWSLNSPCCRFC